MAEGDTIATGAASLSLRSGRNVANRPAEFRGRDYHVWRLQLGACSGRSTGTRRESCRMSSESRNTEQGITEAGASQSKGSGRSGKRLGRGLEDVSQAFHSHPAGEAVRPAVSEPRAAI